MKKLSLASLWIERSKKQGLSSRSIKQKDKSVKCKSTSVRPSSRRHKGHVANNNLSDVNYESLGTDLSKSDEEIEVAAYSKDLSEVTPS